MSTIRQRRGKWQAQVRIKGVAKSATFDTRKQAQLWAAAQEQEIEDGNLPAPAGTVMALMEAYTEYRQQIRPVARGMQHSIKTLMAAPFAHTGLDKVTAKELLAWGQSMRHLNHATVAHHFMVLRSAWSSSNSLIGVKVDMEPLLDAMRDLSRIKVMGKATRRERRISDEELEAICNHLEGKFTLIPSQVYVRLAVALPRRREEICTMLWADYTGDTILLRDTKNPLMKRDELIPVPPAAKEIIDSLPRIDARIFPYKPESVSAAFQRTVREIGLEDIRLHDLRHEGISRLFEQGLQIPEVSLISGHMDWAALKRYTHIKPADVTKKLAKSVLGRAVKQAHEKRDAHTSGSD